MKNFRKVLALILVVATLFSFVAMASAKNAADVYGDYSDVTNKLAVDVVTALGITEGYDGKYHPADTIDRDEVAAMIARLRNGGKFDAALYVGAPNVFADVKGQWSEGYVTYCSQLGIINGLNETTFNPDGKITVVDTLKLLLCVLGYDAKLSGYVGPNYKVAVVRDADKMGLTDGISSADMFKEATRDQVAKMFFNALKARLVYGYVSENIVTITNSLLGSKFYEGITSVTLPALTNAEVAYCNAVISNVTLGNVLGVCNHAAYDCFGRPGEMWFVGSWYKFYPAAYVGEKHDGTCPVDAKKVTQLYVNGEEVANVSENVVKGYLGNGITAEAYALGGDTYRLVVIETVMGKVTSVTKRDGKATITGLDGHTLKVDAGTLAVGNVVKVHDCALNYTIDNGTSGHTHTAIKAHADIDDTLLCVDHENVSKVHDITVVTPIEVVIDETHVYAGTYANQMAKSYIQLADKTQYQYSANLGHDLDLDCDIADAAFKGKTVRLWLDDFGYIQYWEVVTSGSSVATDVAYFVEGSNKFTTIHEGTDVAVGTHVYSATADIVKMDATEEKGIAITIDDKELTAEQVAAGVLDDTYNIMLDRGTNTQGTWKDGVLARYNTANGQMTQVATVAGQNTWLNQFTGELVNQPVPGKSYNYHFTADTRFLVRTWDIATGAPTYEAVTGYKAMPEYLGKLVFGDQKYYNSIQFLADGDYITDLFIDAFYVKTSAEYVYIVEKVKDIGVAGLGDYYYDFAYYKAFIKGAEAYVAYFNVNATENDATWTAANLEAGKLYATTVKGINATYEGAPIYVAMTDANLQPWAAAGDYTDVKVVNGQIELWKEGVKTEIVASNYLDELSVYVLSGAADVPYAIMNGAQFVEKYQNDTEFSVKAATAPVYKLGNPVNILILTIG